MEIYEGPYFRINKHLLQNTGLWPYEKNLAKKLSRRLYFGLSSLILMLRQFYGLYKNFGVRVDRTIEHIAILMYMNLIFLKLITSILAETKLKKVYDSVIENWTSLTDPCERGILSKFSKRGVVLTKAYMAYIVMAALFYVMMPLSPMLMNIIAPLNETRLPNFILNGAFPVTNMRNHYFEIFMFDLLSCINTAYVLVAADTMYACCIEHCIGLFAVIKYRLKLCTGGTDDDRRRDVAYEMIVKIIKLHKKTIAFTDLLEQSYSTSNLVLMGIIIMQCSFVSTLLLIKHNELSELIRYIGILGAMLIHAFYVSWPGQKLIDYSTSLFDDAYTNDWYKISRKSQRLLLIMRMRCLRPCKLTAGRIYAMNLENFASIIKASASYYTVFSSLAQKKS